MVLLVWSVLFVCKPCWNAYMNIYLTRGTLQIVLGALVVESPGCTLSPHALQELEEALPFYEQGSRPCRTAATLVRITPGHIRE